LLQAPALPPEIRLGTSSCSSRLARRHLRRRASANGPQQESLAAYAQIPLLRTVSLDRTFYAPITTIEYARYASQVPDHFSFVVKAPALSATP